MNKAKFKLKGLPPIYCINLDGEPERWEAAESMFKEWDVENYTCLLYTSPSPRDIS